MHEGLSRATSRCIKMTSTGSSRESGSISVALLDSFVKSGNTGKNAEPVNRQYQLLKEQLLRYHKMKNNGGFPNIPLLSKSYRKGDSSIAVIALKKRLFSTEDYKSSDTTVIFTANLENAVKQFQKRYGLKEDGVAGGQTLKLLNEPVDKRIEQLLINMERMRWIPAQPTGDFILVNIPQYRLIAYENGKPAFAMNIVVGTFAEQNRHFYGQYQVRCFQSLLECAPGYSEERSVTCNKTQPIISCPPPHGMEQWRCKAKTRPLEFTGQGQIPFSKQL
jgi:hypothetical protein